MKVGSMPRTSKIAISIPEDVLSAVEQQRESTGESRSKFFRRAVETQIRLTRERELSEQYIRAYERSPESREEVETARRSAANILAGKPWK